MYVLSFFNSRTEIVKLTTYKTASVVATVEYYRQSAVFFGGKQNIFVSMPA